MTTAPTPDERLAPLLEAAGLDPEQRRLVTGALGVQDETGLAFACRANHVRDLEGLGAAAQAALAKALRQTPWSVPDRTLLHARRAAVRVLEKLQRSDTALRLTVVGDVRRMLPRVETVELLATAHEPQALLEHFTSLLIVGAVDARDGSSAAVRLADGTRVSLEVLAEEPSDFFRVLFERTGSAVHVEAVRARAAEAGVSLLDCMAEAEIYARLGLAPVPPELREGDALEAPPEGLVSIGDVRGVVHVHTDAGAGVFSAVGALERAAHEGFGWVVLCDRSPSAFPRGGGADAIVAARAAADRASLDAELDVRAFVGAEARVDGRGALDWPEGALEDVDVVFGVVEDAPDVEASGDPTARYVAAVSHPLVRVLAHPRPGLPAPDWTRVFEAAAAAGTAIEVSGEPGRPVPGEAWFRAARRAGVRWMPAADAFDLDGLDGVLGAVGALRRARVTVSEVLPTLSATAFQAWLKEPAPR